MHSSDIEIKPHADLHSHQTECFFFFLHFLFFHENDILGEKFAGISTRGVDAANTSTISYFCDKWTFMTHSLDSSVRLYRTPRQPAANPQDSEKQRCPPNVAFTYYLHNETQSELRTKMGKGREVGTRRERWFRKDWSKGRG